MTSQVTSISPRGGYRRRRSKSVRRSTPKERLWVGTLLTKPTSLGYRVTFFQKCPLFRRHNVLVWGRTETSLFGGSLFRGLTVSFLRHHYIILYYITLYQRWTVFFATWRQNWSMRASSWRTCTSGQPGLWRLAPASLPAPTTSSRRRSCKSLVFDGKDIFTAICNRNLRNFCDRLSKTLWAEIILYREACNVRKLSERRKNLGFWTICMRRNWKS